MLINPSAQTNIESSEKFWTDELANTRYLLSLVNQAIAELTANPTQSYTLDTGQTKQTVTKADLDQLYRRRDSLIGQIAILESRTGDCSHQATQIIPGF